jgi:hypothetical protein
MKENVSCSSDKVFIEWTDELRRIVYKRYKCDFTPFLIQNAHFHRENGQ